MRTRTRQARCRKCKSFTFRRAFPKRTRILEIFSKYTVFFVEHMMQVELGLLAPDEPPWAKGAVTFVSFCLFGAVPLASYAAVARPASASCSARARFSRPPSSSGPSRAASRRAVSPPLERS